MNSNKSQYLLCKRFIDIVGSIVGLALFSPLMLIALSLIYVNIGSPAFFCQSRPGRFGKTFVLYKFRTMTDERDTAGKLLSDAQRMNPLGKLLRRTSIDELPELYNVLKGDMSLVGPRPLLIRYLPYYTETERRRHDVRPGITGLAQVSGRNCLPWDERLALDVEYVDTMSFVLDMKILLKTIINVIGKDGVIEVPDSVMLNLDEERSLRTRR